MPKKKKLTKKQKIAKDIYQKAHELEKAIAEAWKLDLFIDITIDKELFELPVS